MNVCGIEYWLEDDGTLDTVVSWTCPDCGHEHTDRWNAECAGYYRNPDTGAFDDDGFRAFIEDSYCDGECWYCLDYPESRYES